MGRFLLLVLFVVAAASPAAAQSCATLGAQIDCARGATVAKPANPPPANPPKPAASGEDAAVIGHADAEISNRGVSADVQSTEIDSHGIVEFGFRGTTGRTCGAGPYPYPCE